MNYARLAFTEPIKKLQETNGSRTVYEKVEKRQEVAGLSETEMAFIQERDSFYLASYGENGYPYIQHRGGPPGFLKVLDQQTLGFVDFSGNSQYISVGNFQTHPNVSLFLMSYTQRARLKIYAKARSVDLADDPDLFTQLALEGYKHRPERLIILEVQAFDWNCSQHITPRYTIAEIEAALEPQKQYIMELEKELASLKAQMVS